MGLKVRAEKTEDGRVLLAPLFYCDICGEPIDPDQADIASYAWVNHPEKVGEAVDAYVLHKGVCQNMFDLTVKPHLEGAPAPWFEFSDLIRDLAGFYMHKKNLKELIKTETWEQLQQARQFAIEQFKSTRKWFNSIGKEPNNKGLIIPNSPALWEHLKANGGPAFTHPAKFREDVKESWEASSQE